ncbi:hypothetical protein OKA05_29095 [Luteolibacter arcticus]|uniref:Uncharacterized protein n=1 Tax=Luteolibacter arcticus TaxID=1581411 RepID=A0ABT3GT40_9BACT|nr:hypothetical protein [Luteolibacter arcticus]MCW1926645.1 hypothetical protein [Luteolibacter arcticus]
MSDEWKLVGELLGRSREAGGEEELVDVDAGAAEVRLRQRLEVLAGDVEVFEQGLRAWRRVAGEGRMGARMGAGDL